MAIRPTFVRALGTAHINSAAWSLATVNTTGCNGAVITVGTYTNQKPTSVTLSGTNAVEAVSKISPGGFVMSVWVVVGFTQNTNQTLAVNWSASADGGGSINLFSDVNQVTPAGATNSTSDDSETVASFTYTLTTNNSNSYVVDGVWINTHAGNAITAPTSQQTLEINDDEGTAVGRHASSIADATTQGSFTLGYTWTLHNEAYAAAAVELRGTPTTSTGGTSLNLLGVGT